MPKRSSWTLGRELRQHAPRDDALGLARLVRAELRVVVHRLRPGAVQRRCCGRRRSPGPCCGCGRAAARSRRRGRRVRPRTRAGTGRQCRRWRRRARALPPRATAHCRTCELRSRGSSATQALGKAPRTARKQRQQRQREQRTATRPAGRSSLGEPRARLCTASPFGRPCGAHADPRSRSRQRRQSATSQRASDTGGSLAKNSARDRAKKTSEVVAQRRKARLPCDEAPPVRGRTRPRRPSRSRPRAAARTRRGASAGQVRRTVHAAPSRHDRRAGALCADHGRTR